MDPLTLFALANGAVSAVKAGCKLYKDIKSASGDIKDVLNDLDDQFHKRYPSNKPATIEQRNQYVQEKNRVIDLNKKGGETTGIYQEIGEHLGTYYDNFHKCIAVFEEEEKRSKTEVYSGTDSIGKRALQRVLMKKQLEQMSVELRELMVYQSPPELGALHTEVEDMMKVVGKEQKALLVKQMQNEMLQAKRRKAKMDKLKNEAIVGICILIIIFTFGFTMMYVAQLRYEMYPQYGSEFIPKTDEQRRREKEPQIYVGR
jgi:hypothetical protein